jgi:hypothetical protein
MKILFTRVFYRKLNDHWNKIIKLGSTTEGCGPDGFTIKDQTGEDMFFMSTE